MWIFEPHVAERVFEDLVEETEIPVVRDAWLDREKGVRKDGAAGSTRSPRSTARRYAGKMFIDATYEGDLMAAAGVDYHVGREANSAYGEKWNGVQTGVLHHRHHFGAVKSRSPRTSCRATRERPARRASAPSRRARRRGRQDASRPTASACA